MGLSQTRDTITISGYHRWNNVIHNIILIIVDYYTKMVKYILIIVKLNAIGLVDIIYWEVIFKYRVFYRIISNWGPVFINKYWLEFY